MTGNEDVVYLRTASLVLYFDQRNCQVTVTGRGGTGEPFAPVTLSFAAYETILREHLPRRQKEPPS